MLPTYYKPIKPYLYGDTSINRPIKTVRGVYLQKVGFVGL